VAFSMAFFILFLTRNLAVLIPRPAEEEPSDSIGVDQSQARYCKPSTRTSKIEHI
jgi:hypothetical protein